MKSALPNKEEVGAESPWAACSYERSDSDFGIESSHEIQNHLNHGLIADRSVNHRVVDGAIGPVHPEVLLDESTTFVIDGIDELFGILLTLAATEQTSKLIFSWSIKKYTQSVLAALEELLRSPSDDDRVSRFRRILNHLFCKFQNAFAIDQLKLMRVETPFVASAQERFEEPIIKRIGSFLSPFTDHF